MGAISRDAILIVLTLSAVACGGASSPTGPAPNATTVPPPPAAPPPTTSASAQWNLETQGIPRFVTRDYIDLDQIVQLSRFRSAAGHDYWDARESCRSMKHYFLPRSSADWSAIRIYSPVTGLVSRIMAEWAGTQIEIQPDAAPAFSVVLFHVNLAEGIGIGSRLEAGQQIGTHIGSQTMSDVAVRVDTTEGMRLVSYFEATTDEVFDRYRARGIASREALIISAAERDADPLTCAGETFTSRGTLADWVTLR